MNSDTGMASRSRRRSSRIGPSRIRCAASPLGGQVGSLLPIGNSISRAVTGCEGILEPCDFSYRPGDNLALFILYHLGMDPQSAGSPQE